MTVLPETSAIAPKIKEAFRSVDKDAAEAGRRWRGEIERELKDTKATIKVDADTAKARAEIDEAARDRHSKIHVDVDKSGLDSLTTSLGGIGGAGGGGISAMGVGIAGLIPVASALSGALGLIPAALGGAGAAAGTLVTGLSGVKDAYTAVGDAAKTADKDQKEKTEAVAGATRELQSAIRSEAQAQEDVANARKTARQQLDDLNLSLQGGKIDEAQAYNNLLKARRDLATGTFKDQLDYNDAVLRVDQAQQTYNESIQRNTELQDKANTAQAKGVDGADNVVAANNRLLSTQDQVVAALTKLGDAQEKTSSQQQKVIDTMAELSPVAQTFVNTLQGLKPVWDKLKFSVQDTLFAGVGDQIKSLAQTYMPLLTSVMTSMASTMNQTFGQIAAVLQSPAALAGVQSLFDNLTKAFQAFMPSIPVLVQGFGQLAQVGSAFLPQLGAAFTEAAQGFTKFISQAAASGQLQQWISTGIQAMSLLGNITKTVFKAFLDLGPLGTAIISALDQALTALAPAIPPLASTFTALVDALTPILPVVGTLIAQFVGALAPALTTLFNALAPVITQLASSLTPVIMQLAPVLGQAAMAIAGPLSQSIEQLAPLLGPLVQALGQFFITIAPLITQILKLGTEALPVFTAALKVSLSVFTDVVKLIDFGAKTILPVFMNTLDAFGQMWTKIFNGIKSVVSEVWNFIKPIFENIKGFLDELPGPLKDLIGIHDTGALPQGAGFVPKAPGTQSPVTVGAGTGGSGFAWDKVAQAESNGNWGNDNTGGHMTSSGAPRGGLQITDGTWRSFGGTEFAPTANLATPEQQKIVADRIAFTGYAGQAPQGLGAWETITKGMVPGVTTSSTPPPQMSPTATAPAVAPAMPYSSVPAVPTVASPSLSGLPDVRGAHDQIAVVAQLAQQFGLSVTAGRDDHSKDRGYHPLGEAGDFGNGDMTAQEGQFANFMAQNFGPYLAELINSSPGAQVNIKDGKNTPVIDQPGSIYNSGQAGYHGDHDHIAITDAMAPQFIAAAQQFLGNGAQTSAVSVSSAPLGTPQAPIYTAPAPGQINGTGQDTTKQLGQDVGGDLWEMFGLPGMQNPKDMGITKFFTGLLSGVLGVNLGGKTGGMPASYYANGGVNGVGQGGGGDIFGSILQNVLGIKLPGQQAGMPDMPVNPNSPNVLDAAQFKPPGGPGSPGPGNAPGGPTIDMRGANLGVDPAGFQQTIGAVTASMPRWPALQQHLPGQG